MPELLSPDWAAAVCAALNADDAYRDAARSWEGAVRFEVPDAPGGPRAVWLDLHHGACRGARTGDAATTAEAAFVITGAYDAWVDVLEGRLDPFMGILFGKLKLSGDTAQVFAHVPAAKAMVACAASVETAPA